MADGEDRGAVGLENEAQVLVFSGYTFVGTDANDQAGYSVSSAGDVDGDGHDDLIIGAPYADAGGTWSGSAYLVLAADIAAADAADGSSDGRVDLGNLSGHSGSYEFNGGAEYDNAGISVASAGDVDGDGLDDLLIGAEAANYEEVYLVLAADLVAADGADGFYDGAIDLGNIAGQGGSYQIISQGFGLSFSTKSLSSAGDVDGDGSDDLIISPTGDEAYLIAAADLASADAADGVTDGVIDAGNIAGHTGSYLFVAANDGIGPYPGDGTGCSVSSAGDVDGDGRGDLIIGAYSADVGGPESGEAYLIAAADLAAADAADGITDGVVDLSNIAGHASSYRFVGGNENYVSLGDYLGFSVTSAGDVDGDGRSDLVIGAPSGDGRGQSPAGEAYLIAAADLAAADAADGITDGVIDARNIAGHTASYQFIGEPFAENPIAGQTGASVASAGDVDGDGLDDLLIGAPGAGSGSESGAGYAYLIMASDLVALDALDGATDGVIQLAGIVGEQGAYLLQGGGSTYHPRGDGVGSSVASAGDVDGDGLDDILVGAPYAETASDVNLGAGHLLFGADLAAADAADGVVDGIINLSLNAPPEVQILDQVVAPASTLALSDIVTIVDPDAAPDATKTYRVEVLDNSGVDNFWYAGSFVDASAGFVADDLSLVLIQADTVQTTQTLSVRVYDGYDWSTWESFTLTTDTGPGWFFGWYYDAPGWAWTYGAYVDWDYGWHTDWAYGWHIDWEFGWYFDGAYGWHIDWTYGWSVDWDYGWHIDWAFGWSFDWDYGWSFDWTYGWHIDWAFGWTIDWDYGWHIDWGWAWAPGGGWVYSWAWDYGWSWAWDYGQSWAWDYGWTGGWAFGWSWSWDYGWGWSWDYGWSWSASFGWSWSWDYGWSGSWAYGWSWAWDYGWNLAQDYGWSWGWETGWHWAWLAQPGWVYGPYYGWDFGSYGYSLDYYSWAGVV